MKTQSCKAKGRRLQKAVVKKILDAFPKLATADVRSTSMGCGGVDIQLSPLASCFFPYAVECKNVEGLKKVFDMWDQTLANTGPNDHPLLVISANRQPVLAVITIDELLSLWRSISEPRKV
jgi:hypothetical protein